MTNNEENNQKQIESGKAISVNCTQLSLHPTIACNENFQFNTKHYQFNLAQRVLESIAKSIVFPTIQIKSNKKIKTYYVLGNIAEFAILEAAGFKTFSISILEVEPHGIELIIANLFQPLLIKRDLVSTLFLKAKFDNIYRQLEDLGEDLRYFVSTGLEKLSDATGFNRQGAHKTAASLELSDNEIEFLKCLNLKFRTKESDPKETDTSENKIER